MRSVMRSKIHKATITEANPDYVGSITIDAELIERVGLWENEHVLIASNTTGARLETYVIAGEPSGDLLGARLMAALTEQSDRGVEFAGIRTAEQIDLRLAHVYTMGVPDVLARPAQ